MLTLQTSFYFYFYWWKGFSQWAVSTLPLSLAPNLTLINSLQVINYFSHLYFRWNKFQPRQVWWEGLKCSKVLRLALTQSLVRQWDTWILAVGLFSRWHLPTTTSCRSWDESGRTRTRRRGRISLPVAAAKKCQLISDQRKKKKRKKEKKWESTKKWERRISKKRDFSVVKSFLLQQCSWLNSWRSLVTGDEGSCWPPW